MKPDVIAGIVASNVAREGTLMTDEAGHYYQIGKTFAAHLSVSHGKEDQWTIGSVRTARWRAWSEAADVPHN